MTFTRLHANRLCKLITHLLRGKLSKKKFDFRRVNATDSNCMVTDHCAAVGCALGEFHRVFPSHFRGKFFIGTDDAEPFLALSDKESRHLFVPNRQLCGSAQLSGDATRVEVAANMIAFLRSKGYSYAN